VRYQSPIKVALLKAHAWKLELSTINSISFMVFRNALDTARDYIRIRGGDSNQVQFLSQIKFIPNLIT
jgi:hypothetical protein